MFSQIHKLSEITFDAWGIKFSFKDINWKTILALAMTLAVIVYIIKF